MCPQCWVILRSVLGLKPIWMTQFASSWDLFWLPWDGGSFCHWWLDFHSELYLCHLWLSQTFLLCVFANMVKRTGHRGRAIDVREEPFIPKKRALPPLPPRLLYCPKYCNSVSKEPVLVSSCLPWLCSWNWRKDGLLEGLENLSEVS